MQQTPAQPVIDLEKPVPIGAAGPPTLGASLALPLLGILRPRLAAIYEPWYGSGCLDAKPGRVYFARPDSGVDILNVRRRGDLNGDERIDIRDLAGLLAAYGPCGGDAAFDRYADVNEDGCVTLSDLVDLLAVYGT